MFVFNFSLMLRIVLNIYFMLSFVTVISASCKIPIIFKLHGAVHILFS